MVAQFEIWDNANANIVYAYDTQDDALTDVRAMIAANGAASVATWVLQFDDYAAPPRNIAAGEELVALAFATSSARSVAD